MLKGVSSLRLYPAKNLFSRFLRCCRHLEWFEAEGWDRWGRFGVGPLNPCRISYEQLSSQRSSQNSLVINVMGEGLGAFETLRVRSKTPPMSSWPLDCESKTPKNHERGTPEHCSKILWKHPIGWHYTQLSKGRVRLDALDALERSISALEYFDCIWNAI